MELEEFKSESHKMPEPLFCARKFWISQMIILLVLTVTSLNVMVSLLLKPFNPCIFTIQREPDPTHLHSRCLKFSFGLNFPPQSMNNTRVICDEDGVLYIVIRSHAQSNLSHELQTTVMRTRVANLRLQPFRTMYVIIIYFIVRSSERRSSTQVKLYRITNCSISI